MDSDVIVDLEKWFSDQPKWQQEAARIFAHKGSISEDDYHELYKMCKNEGIDSSSVSTEGIPSSFFRLTQGEKKLRLLSITNIRGVNALSENASLHFDSAPITIVFGQNGSGKSGYVRVIKKICGTPGTEEVLSNVYKKNVPGIQSCRLKVSVDDKINEYACDLKNDPMKELASIDVYDSKSADLYFKNDNKAKYEPLGLVLFEELADLCVRVRSDIDREIKAIKKLKVPDNVKDSMAGKFYTNLSYKNRIEELDLFFWNEELKKNLQESIVLYYKTDINSELKKKKELRDYISQFLNKTQNLLGKLSNEKYNEIKSALIEMNDKKKTAYIATELLKKESSLDGVGLETWKDLWRSAKKYSEEYAYKDGSFPVVSDDSVCVLCQQPLSGEAKSRFLTFQEFIMSDTEIEANKSHKIYDDLINNLPDVIKVNLNEFFLVGNINEKDRIIIERLYYSLSERKEIFSSINTNDLDDVNLETATTIQNNTFKEMSFEDLSKKVMDLLYSYIEQISDDIVKVKELENKERKKELLDNIVTLEGQKWINENKKDIIIELTKVTNLELAKKLTVTNRISKKKSQITDLFLSEKYIKNFNEALKTLGAKHLKIKLSSKTVKGKLTNSLSLENSLQNAPITKVLSEGEQRVVSLSAFIADALSGGGTTPFIFDDPMSSLDQYYETATANFLIELCKERQVIVFTHRLSFLDQLNRKAKEKDISPKFIELYSFYDEFGIPDDLSLLKKNPDKIIRELKNEHLAKANKEWNNKNFHGYEVHASYICRNIRICMEIIVEKSLLNNVITRYKREVTTKGNLITLAKIKEEDCEFIEGFMTKYSFALHSQPLEKDYPFPKPNELEADLDEIGQWIDDFNSRE